MHNTADITANCDE